MTIFVDGYNLIFAASLRMRGFDIRATEASREKLLNLLAKYKALHNVRMIVFFDSGPEAAYLPRRTFGLGMEIVFSDVGSDADSEIKNAVSHDNAPQNIRVVTSDMGIRRFVERYGAQTIGAKEFLDELFELLKDSDWPSDEPIEKYEGGSGDEDAGYWRRVFGEDTEGRKK